MGFIRAYAGQASRYSPYMGDVYDEGDPGLRRLFRVPKKLRKLKVGRALGSVARIAAPFIPGVGGLIGGVEKLAARYGVAPAMVEHLARSYGLAGDPGAPPKPAKKRKAAASGTKAKATKRREKRAERAMRTPRPKGRRKSAGEFIGGLVEALTPLGELAKMIPGRKPIVPEGESPLSATVPAGLEAELAALAGGKAAKIPRGLRLPGARAKQRVINLTALNRALRRVERFEKTAKRVMAHKLYRRTRGSGPSGRPHRAGCRCVVCKRRAA